MSANIESLPNEILCEIYSFISKKSLLNVVLVSKTLFNSVPEYVINFIRKYQKCVDEINKITHEIKETVLSNTCIVDSSDHYLTTGTGYYWDNRQYYWKTKYSIRSFGERITTYVYYTEAFMAFDDWGNVLIDKLHVITNEKKGNYDVIKAEDVNNYYGGSKMMDFIEEFVVFDDEYSDIYKEFNDCDVYWDAFNYRKTRFKNKNGEIIVKYHADKGWFYH